MWSQRAQVARFFTQKHPKNFSAVSPPQNLGGCPVLRIFLILPDFPKILPLVDTRANFEQNPKIRKNREKSGNPGGATGDPHPKNIRFFWVEKKFFRRFTTRKSSICGLSGSLNFPEKFPEKNPKILAFPGLCGPKGPRLPGFSPKNTPKIFPPFHPPRI